MSISVESQYGMTIKSNLKPLCKIACAVCGCPTIPLSFPLDYLLPHFSPFYVVLIVIQ